MEELHGDKLIVALKKDAQRMQSRMKPSEIIDSESVGPTAREYETWINLLDVKRRAHNARVALWNWSVGWLPGVRCKEYESKGSLPINHAKLVDDLLFVHGQQILVDGW